MLLIPEMYCSVNLSEISSRRGNYPYNIIYIAGERYKHGGCSTPPNPTISARPRRIEPRYFHRKIWGFDTPIAVDCGGKTYLLSTSTGDLNMDAILF